MPDTITAFATPSQKGMPILDIAGVSKVFSLNGRPIHALKDVNLQIWKGEFICLIGASGCGKSTLLRIMGIRIRILRYGAYVSHPDYRTCIRAGYGFPGLWIIPLVDSAAKHCFRP
jgi:ABC-type glutathione transport system ATPase component